MREGWIKKRLTDFVWFQRGFDLPLNNFIEGNVPVYGSTSILGFHNVAKVKAPGIITGRSGTLGKFQFSNQDFWPHNTTLWVKDFKGNNEKFAYYLLKTLDFTLFNSGVAVPSLNRNLLNAYIINIPPLETQRKIAKILSNYDDLIENNLKRIKLLEEMAQQTYEEWFVRMRFPGYETATINETTGLPEGWERATIGEYYETSSGGTPSRQNEKFYNNGTIDWVKTKELKGLFILDSEEKITEYAISKSSAKIFPQKTILMGMYGGVHGEGRKSTLGQLGILSKKSSTNQACCAFLAKDKYSYNLGYFYFYLKSKQKDFLNISMGAAQQNISQQVIKKFEFIKPLDTILNKFSIYSDNIFDSILNLQNQNQRLREARDILLPRLMMGLLNVDDIDL